MTDEQLEEGIASQVEYMRKEYELGMLQEEVKLCPICGEKVHLCGKTKDGRVIGSCLDAFTIEQWEGED